MGGAYGHNMNAVGALIAARYMHETGTTDAEMAAVCVSMRRWAEAQSERHVS